MKEIGLYLHIPFCIRKCHYCDFASFAHREENVQGYMNALIKEIESWKDRLKEYEIRSIFVGGGTPTIVPVREMDRIISSLYKHFSIKKGIEFSMEGNPGTINREKLIFYRDSKVNRLSLGLQACQEELLRVLGRIHNYDQFLENYYLAREVGFDNINVDLMFGLPNQTKEQWHETLQQMVNLRPDHISAYSLKIEEGTGFDKLYGDGLLTLPSEEDERNMYEMAMAFLGKYGYHQYEISNFAREGKECIHNKIYWENQEYIGLGLGAHSYLNHSRFFNTINLEEYVDKLNRNESPSAGSDAITIQDEMAETMFLGLRMRRGVSIADFIDRFQKDPLEYYGKIIKKFMEQELLEVEDDFIRLTLKGIDISNQIFVEFLPD